MSGYPTSTPFSALRPALRRVSREVQLDVEWMLGSSELRKETGAARIAAPCSLRSARGPERNDRCSPSTLAAARAPALVDPPGGALPSQHSYNKRARDAAHHANTADRPHLQLPPPSNSSELLIPRENGRGLCFRIGSRLVLVWYG